MFFDEAVEFGEVHAVPFSEASHEQVQRLIHVVQCLYGLCYDEVSFLGFAFNLDFRQFHGDVSGPLREFLGVFCEAYFDCQLLAAAAHFFRFARRCGFCLDV